MRRLILLAPLAAVAACSPEKPFVDLPPAPLGYPVMKQPDVVRQTGHFTICYADRDAAEVPGLAQETCNRYGLQAKVISTLRYQCRLTAPHQANYSCIDPNKRMPDGTYINPLNPQQVLAWKRATGQMPDGQGSPTAVAPPPASVLGAPPPEPVPATLPESPAP